MSNGNGFIKNKTDLKELVETLYEDIAMMKKAVTESDLSIARSDLFLCNEYNEHKFEECEYYSVSLEPVYDKLQQCADLVISELCPELAASYGVEPREFTGKSISVLLGPLNGSYFEVLVRSMETAKPQICEFYHPDEMRVFRVITQPAGARKLNLIIQDITSIQLYHLNVKRYENLFSKAQEISTVGFFQYRASTHELFVTEGVLNIFECPRGSKSSNMININRYISMIHDEDKEEILALISEDRLGSNLDYQHRVLVKDKVKHVHIIASAFFDPIDNSVSLIGTIGDITSSKKVEQDLQRVKATMSEIEELAQIAFWEYDYLRDRFSGTLEAMKILGIAETDLPLTFGKLISLIHEDDKQKFYNNYQEKLVHHRDWEGNYRIRDKLGNEKNIRIICRNFFDYNGKPKFSRGFIGNQTELKQYELENNELKSSKEKLRLMEERFESRVNEKLSEIRGQDKYRIQKYKYTAINELLSRLSDKWLNSLHILSAQMQNCMEAYDYGELTPEKFHENYNTIIDQINEMRESIEVMYKYYPDRKRRTIFRPVDVIEDFLNSIRARYQDDGVMIREELTAEGSVVGDQGEFLQVLEELFTNSKEELLKRDIDAPVINVITAIKDGAYIIKIMDNAGGILESIKDRIFEPYFSSPDKSHSSGLGLYITKVVIERGFDGSIVALNHNSGAMFLIELPLTAN